MVLRNLRFLSSAILVFGLVSSCTPFLVGPRGPDSSLIIGRIVVNNHYVGSLRGLLPLGVLEKGLQVEVQTGDGEQSFKVTTEEQGFFVIPNLPPNNYRLYTVTLEGGSHSGAWERHRRMLRRLPFAPVPGKVIYIGTLFVEISEREESKIREVREEDTAKAFFRQNIQPPRGVRENSLLQPRVRLLDEFIEERENDWQKRKKTF